MATKNKYAYASGQAGVNWDALDAYMADADSLDAQADQQPKSTSLLRRAGDVALSIGVKGPIGLGESIVGLADIPTGGRVGKFLHDKVGYDPAGAKKFVDDELMSDASQQAVKKFSEADGFVDKAVTAVQNPSIIVNAAAESVPQMLGGAAAARKILGVGAKAVGATAGGVGPAMPGALARVVGERSAPIVAGAVGEGVFGAGSAAEQIRQQTPDGELTAGQSMSALGSGTGTALFGAIGGKVSQKLGIGDVDTMLAAASMSGQAKKGITRALLEGFVSEGVLEELPQSIQEQVWQNNALGKPLEDGVDEAAVLGLLTGGAMGGGAAIISRGGDESQGAPSPLDAKTPGDDIRILKTGGTGPLSKAVDAGLDAEASQIDEQAGRIAAMAGAQIAPVESDALDQQEVALPVEPIEAATPSATMAAAPVDASFDSPADLPTQSFEPALPTDVMSQTGAPFQSMDNAMRAQQSLGDGYYIQRVDGGLVLRPDGVIAPTDFAPEVGPLPTTVNRITSQAEDQAAPTPTAVVGTSLSAPKSEEEGDLTTTAQAEKVQAAMAGDTLNKEGKPFKTKRTAMLKQKAVGGDVVPVQGGWVVRSTAQTQGVVNGNTGDAAGVLGGAGADGEPDNLAGNTSVRRGADVGAGFNDDGAGQPTDMGAGGSRSGGLDAVSGGYTAGGDAQAVSAPKPTYEIAKANRDAADEQVKKASAAMDQYPRGDMGLTPDDVKASPQWKAGKAEMDAAMRDLQQANGVISKNFAKESKAERDASRENKCCIPCDHIPRRSWAFFQARDVLRGVIESLKEAQTV